MKRAARLEELLLLLLSRRIDVIIFLYFFLSSFLRSFLFAYSIGSRSPFQSQQEIESIRCSNLCKHTHVRGGSTAAATAAVILYRIDPDVQTDRQTDDASVYIQPERKKAQKGPPYHSVSRSNPPEQTIDSTYTHRLLCCCNDHLGDGRKLVVVFFVLVLQ